MTQFQVKVPRHLTASERQATGEAIIQRIKLRTLEGRDINGEKFTGYSKRYKDSKEFALAGKSSTVDLRFTHEMMDSLEILNSASGSITIGFSNPEAAKKAEWAAASDNGPSRKFLGITDAELSPIISEYAAPQTATSGLAMDILQRIFSLGK